MEYVARVENTSYLKAAQIIQREEDATLEFGSDGMMIITEGIMKN
jgi:hypothetical protein